MSQPPVIPPRPSRSPRKQDPAPTPPLETPKSPPRPSRPTHRSSSPRDDYPSSSLNDLPDKSNISRTSSGDVPHRLPNETGPSPGDEGMDNEAADAGVSPGTLPQSPAETRNVDADLKLHAPRPSLPSSSAEAKIQAVTRTDSHQAAAAGLGGTGSPVNDERERSSHSPAPAVSGTSEDETGRTASEEYTHRLASPAIESRRASRPATESPLRKTSVPDADPGNTQEVVMEKDVEQDHPLEPSSEEPGSNHDDSYRHIHHEGGFASSPSLEAKSRGQGDDDAADEPILTTGGVQSESAPQPPDVSSAFDVRENREEEDKSRTPGASNSRSNSRSTSRHSVTLETARYDSRDEAEKHKPVEDAQEYKPPSPEDDTRKMQPTPAERLEQRPEMDRRKSPSEDLREDSPSSLLPQETSATSGMPKLDAFGIAEQDAWKSETDHAESYDAATDIRKPEDHENMPSRPEMANQRVPSIGPCEEAPDSQERAMATAQSHEDTKSPSPVAAKRPDVPAKPSIPPRPSRRPQQTPPVDASSKPAVPPTETRPPPTIPTRPKPQVPSRPAKPPSRGSSESLTKVTSAGSSNGEEETKDTPPAPKEKPAVPARPGGSRIAALKAGFLSDLNSRLQGGPQGPKPPEKKEEEAPKEKAPLSDARKGRARGPARRKPAVENVAPKQPPAPDVRITDIWNVWQIDENDDLVVGSAGKAERAEPATLEAPEAPLPADASVAPEIVKNAADESADAKPTLEKEESVPPDNIEPPEPAEPEPSKPDEPAPSAPPEPAGTPLASKELLSPIESPSEERSRAGLATEPAGEEDVEPPVEPPVEPAAKPETEEPSPTEDPGPKTENTSQPAPSLDDVIEKMTASADGKRASDGELHSPQRTPLRSPTSGEAK